MAKTQVDYKNALKKIRNARKDITTNGEELAQVIVKEGMLKAKATAPYDTGLTAKSVRSKFYKRESGAEGIIIAPNAHKSEFATRGGNTRFGTNFNLTRYMHSAAGISSGHFRRARPDFMNLTREYLNKIKDTKAKGIYSKISMKYGK